MTDQIVNNIAAPPCEVFRIHFTFYGSKTIPLRDFTTNDLIGARGEWELGERDEPAAYLRGSRGVTIKVAFRATAGPGAGPLRVLIGARGNVVGVSEREVELRFDPASGISQPAAFELSGPLPSAVGRHRVMFEWYLVGDDGVQMPIGESLHTICTTWKPMSVNPDEPTDRLSNWVYKELMLWSSEWAAGATDEKGICDALINNLPRSGLKYGVGAWTVRDMLLKGGGMCAGWTEMFQHLANCQGVYVYRRYFFVDWRDFSNRAVQWNALVVSSGGINQPTPTSRVRLFHDNVEQHPIQTSVAIRDVTEPRYRFFGLRGGIGDGHAVNILVAGGKLFLYDPSHATGPFEINMPLPPRDLSNMGGREIASFKAVYLNHAVQYMMGSLHNGDDFFEAAGENNGMTVQTSLIPHLSGNFSEVTFFWGA